MIILFLFMAIACVGHRRYVHSDLRCIGDHLYGGDGILNDIISLTSLVLGVGMMVDNSINVLDGFPGKGKLISMMRRWKVRAR